MWTRGRSLAIQIVWLVSILCPEPAVSSSAVKSSRLPSPVRLGRHVRSSSQEDCRRSYNPNGSGENRSRRSRERTLRYARSAEILRETPAYEVSLFGEDRFPDLA